MNGVDACSIFSRAAAAEAAAFQWRTATSCTHVTTFFPLIHPPSHNRPPTHRSLSTQICRQIKRNIINHLLSAVRDDLFHLYACYSLPIINIVRTNAALLICKKDPYSSGIPGITVFFPRTESGPTRRVAAVFQID